MTSYIKVVAHLVHFTSDREDLNKPWVLDFKKDANGQPLIEGSDWEMANYYGHYTYKTREVAFFLTEEDAFRWIKHLCRAGAIPEKNIPSIKELTKFGCGCIRPSPDAWADEVIEVNECAFDDHWLEKVWGAQFRVMSLGEFEFGLRKALRKQYMKELGASALKRDFVRWSLH